MLNQDNWFVKLFLCCYFRIIASESSNDITDSAEGLSMGNQTSGPKTRPEIGITGTLTRHPYGGNSGTTALRLPIPEDEELEKR